MQSKLTNTAWTKRARVGLLAAPLLLAASFLGRGTNAAPGSVREVVSVFQGTLGDKDEGTEISTEELRAALADPKALVLDARPRAEYGVSHIPGARVVGGKPGTAPSQYVPDLNDVVRMTPDRSRRIILYCNGLNCGRSRRFASELIKAGYTNVQRYQLGIPTWRALGGVTQVEKEALLALRAQDRTSVLVDAREPGPSRAAVPGAVSIPLAEAPKAKDDGRLPMADHNTRIFVIAENGRQARAVAEAIVRNAFHNVAFFDGALADLGLGPPLPSGASRAPKPAR
jgi:rhodanese-related sulfurtransferase